MAKRHFNIEQRREVFASRLTECLEEKGITQTVFAEMMMTTQQTISRWCNGQCEPDIDSIILICGYLGETPNYLLGYEEEGAKKYAHGVVRDIAGNDKSFRKEQREIYASNLPYGEQQRRDIETFEGYYKAYLKKYKMV